MSAARTSTTTTTTTTRTRARRTAVAGLLALTVLGGTAAAGTTAASAHPRTPAKPAVVQAAQTTDFGYLTKLTRTRTGTTITLDRAIMHTGKAAKRQQAMRGLDQTTDFYIQNDNPLLRTFRVAPTVKVYGSQVLTGSPARKQTTLARLQTFLASRPKGVTGPPFTLVLDRHRRVVQISELYLS